MSSLPFPELWFISPPDTGSGFLFIATHTTDYLDDIARLLIDNEYHLAASLCDESSRFHVKNDCGIVYCSCTSDDGLPFIGGSIIPYLSKRKLVGRLAIPTFLLGMAMIIIMVFLIMVMISATLALLFGNVELALIIGRNYSILFPILLILVIPFLPFAVPLIMFQRKYKRILSNLKTEVEELLKSVFPEHEVHEVENYYHMMSKRIPKMLSSLIDQFSERIPDVTSDQLMEYDTSEYSS